MLDTNTLYAGMGAQHPGLWSKGLFIAEDEIHWINEKSRVEIGEVKSVMARTRYRQPLKQAQLHNSKEGIYLIFEEPISAIAPGQFAAWYVDDVLLGSGVINQR